MKVENKKNNATIHKLNVKKENEKDFKWEIKMKIGEKVGERERKGKICLAFPLPPSLPITYCSFTHKEIFPWQRGEDAIELWVAL